MAVIGMISLSGYGRLLDSDNFPAYDAMKNLVSIILPTFNRAHFLGCAIDSVLNQTYTNFELIIVDDGSTDNTRSVIESYIDSRIIKIFQENKGVSSARNAALRIAKGCFITFLDSDDFYHPDKLSAQVSYFHNNPNAYVLYTQSDCSADVDGLISSHVYKAPFQGSIYPYISFLVPVTVTIPTVMFRRIVFERIGFFDEAMYRFEDTDYWRRVAKQFSFDALHESTVTIRTHIGNHLVSQSPTRIYEAIQYYIHKVESEDFADVPCLIRYSGYRRLSNYYIAAFKTLATDEGRQSLLKLTMLRDSLPKPLVSIIIPVYNGSDFLADAIESCISQTYQNIEIIVVNDGSSDNGATRSIARSFGLRVRYYEKPNGGVASALNYGISQSSGSLISWLSHDDVYPPNKIAQQIDFLLETVNPTNTVIYGDYAVFHGRDVDGKTYIRISPPPPELFRQFITKKNILHGCTLLIPKSLFTEVGYFDESLLTTQDYDLWYRMALKANFVHLPVCSVYARSHKAQGSLSLPQVVAAECDQLLSRFVENLTEREVLGISDHALADAYMHLAKNLESRGFIKASQSAARLADGMHRLSYEFPSIDHGLNYSNYLRPLPPAVVRLRKGLRAFRRRFAFFLDLVSRNPVATPAIVLKVASVGLNKIAGVLVR